MDTGLKFKKKYGNFEVAFQQNNMVGIYIEPQVIDVRIGNYNTRVYNIGFPHLYYVHTEMGLEYIYVAKKKLRSVDENIGAFPFYNTIVCRHGKVCSNYLFQANDSLIQRAKLAALNFFSGIFTYIIEGYGYAFYKKLPLELRPESYINDRTLSRVLVPQWEKLTQEKGYQYIRDLDWQTDETLKDIINTIG